MVIKALMKIFGGGGQPDSGSSKAKECVADAGASGKLAPKTSVESLEGFVEYVVKALVDSPEEVKVSSGVEGDGKIIKISCRKEDVGKIVGKKGKTIIALRSLVGGAASRIQEKVSVEVID